MRIYLSAVVILALIVFADCQSGSVTSTAHAVSQYSQKTAVRGGTVSSDEAGETWETGAPGWRKADLYAHSLYSDGDSPV